MCCSVVMGAGGGGHFEGTEVVCYVKFSYLRMLSMPLMAKIYSLKGKDLADSWFELSNSSKALGAHHDLCHIVLSCRCCNKHFGMFINMYT